MNLNFEVGKYELHLRAIDTLLLPKYKGSTFRGGFGSTFKRLTCCQPQGGCTKCLVAGSCPYHYVFETSPSSDAVVFAKYKDAPRPFIIEPPLTEKEEFRPGEDLTLGLILVGKAVAYLPYFIVVFQALGNEGIGKHRGRFEVTGVSLPHQNGRIIYNCEGQIDSLGSSHSLRDFLAIPEESLDQPESELMVGVKFVTPCRLVSQGALQDDITFALLFKAVLRRISSLAYFHGNEEIPIEEVHELNRQATLVKTFSKDLYWYDWERYSSRQNTRMKLGGLLGTVVFKDIPNTLLPWLLAGELLHVGKGVTFGLGQYHLKFM